MDKERVDVDKEYVASGNHSDLNVLLLANILRRKLDSADTSSDISGLVMLIVHQNRLDHYPPCHRRVYAASIGLDSLDVEACNVDPQCIANNNSSLAHSTGCHKARRSTAGRHKAHTAR